MIPKKIHYCWLGGKELPEDAQMCIDTWKKILPDYELICWNENNFDINSVDFVKEAISVKKWAFAADYIRLYAVYTQGGVYMDTDVIVKKSFDKFLKHSFFTAIEVNDPKTSNALLGGSKEEVRKYLLQSAIFGAEAGNKYIKSCMDWYKDKHFILPDGSFFNKYVAPDIYAEVAEKYGLQKKDTLQDLGNGMVIYPSIVFTNDRYGATKETYAIHWWKGTWRDKNLLQKILSFVSRKIFLLRNFNGRQNNDA